MQSNLSSDYHRHLNPIQRAAMLSRAYADFVDQTIIDFVGDAGTDKGAVDEVQRYLTTHGWFITFTFYDRSCQGLSNRLNSDNPLMIKLDHLYKLVCRELLGPRYAKHRNEQPLCIAALDINSTRYRIAPSEVRNPHLHSIWVARPGTETAFISFINHVREDARFGGFGFKDIDIKPIISFKQSVGDQSVLGSYCPKFLGRNTDQMVYADDFRVYPVHRR
ncbi:hypothetical protein IHQ71_28415 [Rhizobium sp. TH2]|uniref:hypothetical protein n=1 Tax=Rhizobium sp. TH2 TaxID=2775403 RepID=UPI0021575407|nr:hypothetical protein [Rhizobium sp. TH2]UVC08989.1 hypothetical protein IHQ71_28415 [Rhizobium sp. TH2]